MSSTPLISSSSGVATVWAMTSAEAPGYVAVTLTVGGAISGYSETGRPNWAMPPTIRMMIDRTEAKIGRSMKKWEKRMGWELGLLGAGKCHPERSEGPFGTGKVPRCARDDSEASWTWRRRF